MSLSRENAGSDRFVDMSVDLPAGGLRPTESRRGAGRAAGLGAAGRKGVARRRRALAEALESRQLMSVTSVPLTVGDQTLITDGNSTLHQANPSLTYNPLNPNMLVAGFDRRTTTDVYSAFGRFSIDGGVTWTPMAGLIPGNDADPELTDDVMSPVPFARSSDASVSFDRNNQLYYSYREYNADASIGQVSVIRIDFTGVDADTNPVPVDLGGGRTKTVLARWSEVEDQIFSPTIKANANLQTFTDPTTGAVINDQTFVGAQAPVYVAYADASGVYLAGSSDGGAVFSVPVQLADGIAPGASTGSVPQIVVSQGSTGGASAGQATVLFYDYVNSSIFADINTDGAAGFAFSTVPGPIEEAASDAPSIPTNFAFNVTIPVGVTVQSLSLTINALKFDLDDLDATLTDPQGNSIQLFALGDLTGDHLGLFNDINPFGTTFIDTAPTVIDTGTASYTGQFKATGGALNDLLLGNNSGAWILTFSDNNVDDPPPGNALISATLQFGTLAVGGAVDVAVASNLQIGGGLDPLNDNATTSTASPDGIGVGLVGASDNTLGSFSPFQGRLYVAYVDGSAVDTNVMLTTSDDGGLTWSQASVVNDDDTSGGLYNPAARVSTGMQFQPAIAVDDVSGTVVLTWLDTRHDSTGAQITTQIAYGIPLGEPNSVTPGLFNSLNPRYSGSTMIDGVEFLAQQFVNTGIPVNDPMVLPDPYTGLTGNRIRDAITGTVYIRPNADDFSAANLANDTLLNLGYHQAVVVYGGRVHVAWAGNQDSQVGRTGTQDIYTTVVQGPAGPRVAFSEVGAVTEDSTISFGSDPQAPTTISWNNTFSVTDGSREFGKFLVVFDRPIDISTFTAAKVHMTYRGVTTAGTSAGTVVPVNAVQPLDAGIFGALANGVVGATRFLVSLTTPQTNVGTYSFYIDPTVGNRVRYVNPTTGATFAGTLMDQDHDGVGGEAPQAGVSTGDIFSVPAPALDNTFTDAGGGVFFVSSPFASRSLPLFVAGPRVAGVTAVGEGGGLSTSADALILEEGVTAIDVTFDRSMDPTSITPDTLQLLTGPTGLIRGNKRYTAPDSGVTIPDFTTRATPLRSSLLVEDAYPIGTARVQVDVGHLNVGDLKVELIAPNGTVLVLANNRGGTGDNFTNTLFSDDSSIAITDATLATAPFSAANGYRPEDALSALAGLSSQGIWKLRVTDTVNGTSGILNNWSLILTPAASAFTASVSPADPGNNTIFRFGIPTQRVSGTYSFEIAPSATSAAGDMMDTDGNAGLEALLGLGSTTVTQTYNSADAPRSINGIDTSLATVGSAIIVADSYLITDVSLQLNISHNNVPDLTATLVAPDGTTEVVLFSNVGSVGSRRNFTNTILKDPATGQVVTPIQNGQAPFTGTYAPEQSLLTALSGFNVNTTGTGDSPWRLKIERVNGATVTGTLNSWSLSFTRAVAGTNTGGIADTGAGSFRIFSVAGDNAQSHSMWTAVGPASINQPSQLGVTPSAMSGRIGDTIADPSDPSGNTVFVAAANGGIWRTTNFLNPNGQPTYVPLTDFGSVNSMSVGSLAAFGRNSDPDQTVLFAGTGDPDTSGTGVGFLRSLDGGSTWVVLDSLVNADSSGALLPFSQRDHAFVGSQIYKVVVDPRATATGEVVVYAAVGGGASGGLYRSLNSGKNWTLMRAGECTDVTLDLNSGYFDQFSNPTGNVQYIYGAFRGEGVFFSPNRGQTFSLMLGTTGNPLIQDGESSPSFPAIPVGPSNKPNGANGRILLAKPGLTGNSVQDNLYQGFLYALVISEGSADGLGGLGGDVVGVYVTKDFGQNWTEVQGVPNLYSGGIPQSLGGQGNRDVTFAVDPTNPYVLYMGGTTLTGGAAFARLDITFLSDPHAFFTSRGGTISPGVQVKTSATSIAPLEPTATPLINLIADPTAPFVTNATVRVLNTQSFLNAGANARVTTFGSNGLGANAISHSSLRLSVDAATGLTRLIYGTDQGVFTSVGDIDGSELAADFTQTPISGSRNGNLQIAHLRYSAAQPSDLAAQAAGALFYSAAAAVGAPQSDADILTTGNLAWNSNGPNEFAAVAVNQAFEPNGASVGESTAATVYFFAYPSIGGDGTNFFLVNGISRVNGLLQNTNGTGLSHDDQWPDLAGSNFAVNPIDGRQMAMGSQAGRLFGTADQGRFWTVLANPVDLDGSYVSAPAYGAPDPDGPGGGDVTNFFIYAGTTDGNIFVTFTGGGGTTGSWTNLSAGLDGSTVRQIITNPNRGSHEAYAVTDTGVFYMADSSDLAATWVDVTGDLFANVFSTFGDPSQSNAYASRLTALAVDWRYAIPDNISDPNGPSHPVLYVGANAGVYRSFDDGQTWKLFPDVLLDGAAQSGGYLPSAEITDLDLVLGDIDPTTGQPKLIDDSNGTITPAAVGPSLLLASTKGRGAFAIRIAPLVVPTSVTLAPGEDTGSSASDFVTQNPQPTFRGYSEISAFGNVVRITLVDLTNPLSPRIIGGFDPGDLGTDVVGNRTDVNGFFSVQVNSGAFTVDGEYVIGIQAVDASGIVSTATKFDYVLDRTIPAAPSAPTVDVNSDNGRSNSDGITNDTTPLLTGTGDPGATVSLFRSGTLLGTTTVDIDGSWFFQIATPLTEGIYSYTASQVDLAGNTGPASESGIVVIDTTAPSVPGTPDLAAGSDTGTSNSDNNTTDSTPTMSGFADPNATVTLLDGTTVIGTAIADSSGAYTVTAGTALADGVHQLKVRATDLAGNSAADSAALGVNIDTAVAAPAAPDLSAGSDSGASATDNVTNVRRPTFTGTAEANALVVVLVDGAPAATATATTGGIWTATLSTDLAEGGRVITARQTDAAGNVSVASTALNVTIDLTAPAAPATPDLLGSTDSGTSTTDNITNNTRPAFTGTAGAGETVRILLNGVLNGTTIADPFGAWLYQVPTALASGTYNVTAQSLDTAGNASSVSNPLTISIDLTAPTVASPDLTAGTDSGSSTTDNITSNTTPSFTGTTEANAAVSLFDGGTLVGTATANSGGVYTVTVSSPLTDGAHDFTIRATDSAGNVSTNSSALTVTIDTTAPAPGTADLVDASDAGTSNSDNITNVTTPTLSGTAEANATVVVLVDGVARSTVTASPLGIWTSTLTTALTEGSRSITATQTDVAGNVSGPSSALLITVDTTVPTAPGTPDLRATSDSGTSDTDNRTNVTTPVFTGTSTAGITVRLFAGSTEVGSTVADGSGAWVIAVNSALADGSYNFTARTMDTAGNLSVASAALPVVIDTTAPAVGAPNLTAGTDTGVSSTDNITQSTTPSFTGTTEANASVTLFDGVNAVGNAVADGTGAYTVTVAAPLADGAHSFSVQSTDVAGNTSGSSAALLVTIDNAAPSAPSVPDLDASSDTGNSTTDNLTKQTKPTFSGTSEANATVVVLVDGVARATATASSVGVWTATLTTDLTEGAHAITATQTDRAGNTGVASSGLTITIDTTSSTGTPGAPDLAAGSDTGLSSTDNITANALPTFTGTAPANAPVQVLANGNVIASGTATAGGAYSLTPTISLADGVFAITAVTLDPAGNASPASAPLSVTIDSQAPSLSVAPAVAAGSDSGSSNSDAITSVRQPVITGTSEAAARITLLSGSTPIGTATANGTGVWSITPGTALVDGTYTLTYTSTDIAGNISTASPALTLTIDGTAPAAPSGASLQASSDTGSSATDLITSNTRPRFLGTGEVGATVSILANGTSIASGTVAVDGTYSIRPGTDLAQGSYAITITQQDTAGNTSAASAAATLLIDTAGPVAVAQTLTATKGTTFTGTVATFTDASGPGTATIDWGDTTTSAGTIAANTSGGFTVTGTKTYALGGTYTVSISITDAAGNTSTVTTSATVGSPAVTPTGGLTITGTENTVFAAQPVATFVDTTGAEDVSVYAATIDWGDSTTSAGTISFDAGTNVFTVNGSHLYGEDGSYTVGITITKTNAPSATTTSTATIANTAVTPSGNTLTTNEGVAFSGVVATFVDNGTTPSASNYSGTIDWGDGTTTPFSSVVADGNNPRLFSVTGTHTYADGPAGYSVRTIIINEGGPSAEATSSLSVANVAPNASLSVPSTAFIGSPVSIGIGGTDNSPADQSAGFSYTVNFGDGSAPLVLPGAATGTTVTHSYASGGNFTVTVTATDRDGAVSNTSSGTLLVTTPPTLGGVIIGDPATGGSTGNDGATVSDAPIIRFSITAAGTTLPDVTVDQLTLTRNAKQTIPLSASQLTSANGQTSLDLSTLPLPDGDYELRIRSANSPDQYVRFSRLAGDINGDGVVNSKDQKLVSKSIGKSVGQAGFTAGSDVDKNGVVNKADLKFVKSRNGARIVASSKTVSLNTGKKIKVPSLAFKTTTVGTDARAFDLVLKNTSKTKSMDISELLMVGDSAFAISLVGQPLGTQTATIAPNTSIRVRVYFTPTVVTKVFGAVQFKTTSGGITTQVPLVVPLSGKGK